MREFSLGLGTNTWNAVRFVLATLVLVPIAEKLWALALSKRTGMRLNRGHTARLRQSKLSHWGLHQEVDESSRLSRATAIVVCVLHIAGALLLEYGSGTKERYSQRYMSSTPTFEGGMLAEKAYFVDAGYIYGKKHGSARCIDGEPRKISDFGIFVAKKPAYTYDPYFRFPPPNRINLRAQYRIPNTDRSFLMYEEGFVRRYGVFEKRTEIWGNWSVGFVDGVESCRSVDETGIICTTSLRNEDHLHMLSAIIANAAVDGAWWINHLWIKTYWDIIVNLNNVSICRDQRCKKEIRRETNWVREGMPRKERNPSYTNAVLHIKIKSLKQGCNHQHAVYISPHDYLQLDILNVSVPGEEKNRAVEIGDSKLLYAMTGNRAQLLRVTKTTTGYCSSLRNWRLCVENRESGIHEMALYTYDLWGSFWSHKEFSILFRGALQDADTLNVVVQVLIEITSPDRDAAHVDMDDVVRDARNFFENNGIYSKLVRAAETKVVGNSALPESEIATVNVLGIVGIAILIILIAVPVPMLLYYRRDPASNIEILYRRLLNETGALHINHKMPDDVPAVAAKEMCSGNGVMIEGNCSVSFEKS